MDGKNEKVAPFPLNVAMEESAGKKKEEMGYVDKGSTSTDNAASCSGVQDPVEGANKSGNDYLTRPSGGTIPMEAGGEQKKGERQGTFQQVAGTKPSSSADAVGAGGVSTPAAETDSRRSPTTAELIQLLVTMHELMSRFEALDAQWLQMLSQQNQLAAELRTYLDQMKQMEKWLPGKHAEHFVVYNPPSISTFPGNRAVPMTALIRPILLQGAHIFPAASARNYGEWSATGISNIQRQGEFSGQGGRNDGGNDENNKKEGEGRDVTTGVKGASPFSSATQGNE